MSISEKLKRVHKKAKTAVITGVLAMAAVASPLKGQSVEATAEKDPSRTAEVSKAQKARQQLFEVAVRANLPKEEIAKYVDFPEFIPVDKNGQLDKKQVDTLLSDMVTNHLAAVKKFYRNLYLVDAPDPKKQFDGALTTFITDISGDKKETSELLKKISKLTDDSKWSDMKLKVGDKYTNEEKSNIPFVMMGMSVVLGLIGMYGTSNKKKAIPWVIASTAMMATAALGLTIRDIPNREDVEKRLSDPKDAITFMQDGVKQVYDAYLDGSIQTEKDRQTDAARIQFNRRAKKIALTQRK